MSFVHITVHFNHIHLKTVNTLQHGNKLLCSGNKILKPINHLRNLTYSKQMERHFTRILFLLSFDEILALE